MKQLLYTLLLAGILLTGGSSTRLCAQDKNQSSDAKGFRQDCLKDIDYVRKKFADLAGAMPAESYAWRPMEGVRSVSEVFVHVTLDNYNMPNFVGFPIPDGMNDNLEKTVTDKGKIIDMLNRSFDNLRDAISKTSDADLDKPTKMFGRDNTYRGVFFAAINHVHEHLGQAIAYARMNKVVPPWTAAQEAAAKEKKSGK